MSEIDIPPEILAECQPGDTLIPVQTKDGLEWWWFDESGEFVEAFWQEEEEPPSPWPGLGMAAIVLAVVVVVAVAWAV